VTLFATALLLLLVPPRTGEELVRQMHARYDGKWYQSLTFVQTTTFGDGRQETWYEALVMPGRLRIDIAPLADRSTIIFSGDSIYQWQKGTPRPGQPFVHPLLVLGFDVYTQPVDRTLQQLRGLGYDLTKIHADSWQGRAVWVVGADSGDVRTKQFWIDQERLVFVRSLELVGRDVKVVSEIQFNRYRPLGNGWIAPEVQMFRDGKLQMKEEYEQVRTDIRLPGELWDAGKFPAATWMN
jgi:outer membrane lipoprotein-sorting protein